HRILFSWPDRVPLRWTDVEPHPAAIAAFEELFEGLLALEMNNQPSSTGAAPDPETIPEEPVPHVIGWTPEGKRAWVEHVETIARELNSEEVPDNLRGPWSKLEGTGARLALVLHVCRQVMGETPNRDVDEVSMRNATMLVDYFKAHARRTYPHLTN